MGQPGHGGYDAEEEAFHQFARGVDPIAEHIRELAGGDLSGHAELADDAFSKVGNEVGLSAAIRDATRQQIGELNGLADSTGLMGQAVRNTWNNYQVLEDDHTSTLRSTWDDRA
ncbi:MAG: hypothetical protein GEU98_08980 [Pseudonocardiaceae bacterium]|nr:hypothetical protein [Pseudonocardiaceae bacterium]